ncbi:hypothetical protein DMC30DRAFT_446576 [Rhodotorula diobovata]|uniref:Uncharacterized protein n=1 Tax=Rhodotorula diobovata TaxID=5288 RepID=A0A5C5FY64_9BASI|nr:hypothetical protein DMC30DRAFT_446576 [Rhodotorula diobovata]
MSTIAKTEAHAGAGDLGENPAPPQAERYEEGKEGSHNTLDSKDGRSLANNIAAASRKDKEGEDESNSAYAGVGAAEAHGNNPSRGARIDAELQAEEEELLKKKQA